MIGRGTTGYWEDVTDPDIKKELEAAVKTLSDEDLDRCVGSGSEIAAKERERRATEPVTPKPVCTSGDTKGYGATLEICKNGQWVSSPEAWSQYGTTPATTPATYGGGETMVQNLYTNPYSVGSPEWMEEVYGPRAGYMTGLGLFGKQGRSPYQSYQERMYDPLSRLYDLSSQFTAGGVGGYEPGGFMGQWGQPYAENPFAMYAQARGMMGDVMGMAPEQRAGFGLQGPTAALQDLLGMGLRQQIGLPGASWLSGRLPQEQESWVAQHPQGQGPNFMDYIKAKYNLGQYF